MQGNYENGQKDGYGVFSWPDGTEYRGEWRTGKPLDGKAEKNGEEVGIK